MIRSGKGRILAGLVSLVILACLLPVGAMAYWSTDYNVGYVAGNLFVKNGNEQTLDISSYGTGTVVFDGTDTLTLSNVNITNLNIGVDKSVPPSFIYTNQLPLTIKLVGTNSITCKYGEGIKMGGGTVTIVGTKQDTLTFTTDETDCISAPKVLVDGANLTVNQLGDHHGIYAWDDKDAFTLQNKANVNVTSKSTTKSAISAKGTIGIMGGSMLTVKGPAGSSTTRAVPSPVVSSTGFTVDGGSVVSVDAGENNEALTVTGPLMVKDRSTLNVTGVVETEDLTQGSDIVEGSITIKDSSTLEVTGQVRASGDITITNSTVKGESPENVNGYATLFSHKAINIDNSTVTVNSQGNDDALSAHVELSILNSSKVNATSQMNCVYTGGRLTIDRSTVEALQKAGSNVVAIRASKGISIQNATVTAKGGKVAGYAVYAGGYDGTEHIIITDAKDGSPSEIIVDGGIYVDRDAKISITPAPGTMMQVHARLEETGELKFESYFDSTQTFQAISDSNNPYSYLLFGQPYVHIKAHNHVFADTWTTSDDSDEHWHACTAGCSEKKDPTPHTAGVDWESDGNNHWQECTVCGAIMNKVTHTPGNWQSDKNQNKHWQECTVCGAIMNEATHTAGGDWKSDGDNHWKICTVCGGKTGEAAHDFQWIIDKAETETVDGSQHEECKDCKYKKAPVAIPATGHHFSTDWTHDADSHWHACKTTGCDAKKDQASHEWAVESTSTEHWQKCKICNRKTTPEKHTFDTKWTVVANEHWHACTTQGCNVVKDRATHAYTIKSYDDSNHWLECVCGAKHNVVGHTLQWVIDKAETETEAGSKHEECTGCEYKKPAVGIPPTGHKQHVFDTKWTSDANAHWHACTTAGCGEIKDKADHTFQWFTDQEATETAPGSKHGVCAVCQYRVDNVAIPPKGHKEHTAGTEWKSDGNAHWHVCTTVGCGEIVDSALHTFQWVTDQAATETAPGSKHGVCTVCGYTTAPVAIPAMGKPSVPQTGDTAPLALWMVLLLASGTAAAVLVKRRQSSR